MPTIALQQVSSKFARENADRTLHKPIALRFIARHLSPSTVEHLEESCPGGTLFVWGAKLERSHQTSKVVERESLVLFRRGPTIYKRGVVVETAFNEALAESLWGRDSAGETWPYVFFFANITDMNRPAALTNKSLGRSPRDNWQGLVVLSIKESEAVQTFFAKELREF